MGEHHRQHRLAHDCAVERTVHTNNSLWHLGVRRQQFASRSRRRKNAQPFRPREPLLLELPHDRMRRRGQLTQERALAPHHAHLSFRVVLEHVQTGRIQSKRANRPVQPQHIAIPAVHSTRSSIHSTFFEPCTYPARRGFHGTPRWRCRSSRSAHPPPGSAQSAPVPPAV